MLTLLTSVSAWFTTLQLTLMHLLRSVFIYFHHCVMCTSTWQKVQGIKDVTRLQSWVLVAEMEACLSGEALCGHLLLLLIRQVGDFTVAPVRVRTTLSLMYQEYASWFWIWRCYGIRPSGLMHVNWKLCVHSESDERLQSYPGLNYLKSPEFQSNQIKVPSESKSPNDNPG